MGSSAKRVRTRRMIEGVISGWTPEHEMGRISLGFDGKVTEEIHMRLKHFTGSRTERQRLKDAALAKSFKGVRVELAEPERGQGKMLWSYAWRLLPDV